MAIYGKGFLLTGDAGADISETHRVFRKFAEFPKNMSDVTFVAQATGKQSKLPSGGTDAEERHLAEHPSDLLRFNSSKTKRWTIGPSNGKLRFVWVLGDVWDFHSYDPWGTSQPSKSSPSNSGANK